MASPSHEDFALMYHVDALPALHAAARASGATLRFSVLEPVHPALGIGRIRVLCVREDRNGHVDVVGGYESYERID